MADDIKATIRFVSGGASSMPHYNSFLPLIPREIKMDFQGLDLYRDSLYQIEGKKDVIVVQTELEYIEKGRSEQVCLLDGKVLSGKWK